MATITCPECQGRKTITRPSGSEFWCPNCGGYGKVTDSYAATFGAKCLCHDQSRSEILNYGGSSSDHEWATR